MPLLDVTEVLLDPDFCEELVVKRRTQVVDNRGIASYLEQILNPIGVVTQGNPASVQRAADYTVAKGNILVHAYAFVFQEPMEDGACDIVLWNGNNYMVRKSYDWSTYGVGFTAAECEFMQTVKA